MAKHRTTRWETMPCYHLGVEVLSFFDFSLFKSLILALNYIYSLKILFQLFSFPDFTITISVHELCVFFKLVISH